MDSQSNKTSQNALQGRGCRRCDRRRRSDAQVVVVVVVGRQLGVARAQERQHGGQSSRRRFFCPRLSLTAATEADAFFNRQHFVAIGLAAKADETAESNVSNLIGESKRKPSSLVRFVRFARVSLTCTNYCSCPNTKIRFLLARPYPSIGKRKRTAEGASAQQLGQRDDARRCAQDSYVIIVVFVLLYCCCPVCDFILQL